MNRLWVIWDNIRNRVFWSVYEAAGVVPQVAMNRRTLELLEKRIEKLETRLRQLGEAAVTGSDRT